MRQKPNLPDAEIKDCLYGQYGIKAVESSMERRLDVDLFGWAFIP